MLKNILRKSIAGVSVYAGLKMVKNQNLEIFKETKARCLEIEKIEVKPRNFGIFYQSLKIKNLENRNEKIMIIVSKEGNVDDFNFKKAINSQFFFHFWKCIQRKNFEIIVVDTDESSHSEVEGDKQGFEAIKSIFLN